MAGLLVSVRSAREARQAVAGGAAIIDVKEPDRGPLGRAEATVWQAVRATVPPSIPVSAALGEIGEWDARRSPDDLTALTYGKLGLAGAGTDWRGRWARLRSVLPVPAWIAVSYRDWREAAAPGPDEVLDEAIDAGCAGILFDTWRKGVSAPPIDPAWLARAREAGLLVTLAGGLDEAAIHRLASLAPDFFAVRGAACAGGERSGVVEAALVSRLVQAAAEPPSA